MKGWKTRTFTERTFTHHRKMGTGMSTLLTSRFRFGKQDYYLGGHPLWEIFRSMYQMKKSPTSLAVYSYSWVLLVSADACRKVRAEGVGNIQKKRTDAQVACHFQKNIS